MKAFVFACVLCGVAVSPAVADLVVEDTPRDSAELFHNEVLAGTTTSHEMIQGAE